MSNLYVNQIFSEQPLAVWALDEDITYPSLISDAERDLSSANWVMPSGTASTISVYDRSTEPYYAIDSVVNKIETNSATTSNGTIVVKQTTVFSTTDYFNVSFYYFKTTPYLSEIKIGYEIGGVTTYATKIDTTSFYDWEFVSAKFNTSVTNAKAVIEFKYAAPATSDKVSFLINGLSIGKWSEVSNMSSLGAIYEQLPEDVSAVTNASYGVKINKHGSLSDYGYYLSYSEGDFYARSTAHTMAFGGLTSVTIVPPLNSTPSLVVPGYGMFNESDKYKSRTLEMWLRIKTKATTLTRIVGPVSSEDGLYVEGAFFVLKAGKYSGSYYVGEWQRPMLVQISYSSSRINLFVNGANAISINFDEVPVFADQFDPSGNSQDWIGFYASSSVPSIDIDTIAIYPYECDSEKSIRRFGYAQATRFPDYLVAAHGGQTMYPDYSFANYGNTKSYGNNMKESWEQGIIDNFDVDLNILKTKTYSLPTLQLEPTFLSLTGYTEQKFFEDFSTYTDPEDPVIQLTPGPEWDTANNNLLIESMYKLVPGLSSIYMVATRSENNTSRQVLFKIYDPEANEQIEVSVITETSPTTVHKLEYTLILSDGQREPFAVYEGNVIDTKFVAGIDIVKFKNVADTRYGQLLSRPNLRLYIGGAEDFTQTFTGKIYKVGLCDKNNMQYIQDQFPAGTFDGTESVIDDHYATYTLNAKSIFDIASFDVSTRAYWRDTIPLSYFAKEVETDDSEYKYRLDMLQVNVDVPEMKIFSGGNYDTSSLPVKVYVSFVPKNFSELNIVESLPQSKIVEVVDTYLTAYEVVDGTLIRMPESTRVNGVSNESVTFHIVADANNTSTYQVAIKSLQIGSIINEVYDTTKRVMVTKYGAEIVPFFENDTEHNLFVMPRYADQHYYLSNNSGIKMLGSVDGTYGYYMPINKNLSDDFNLGSLQISMKLPLESVSTDAQKIFYIDLGSTEYRFYIDSYNSSNTRAVIYAKYFDGTSETDANVQYYLNNYESKTPVVNVDEWFILNVNFKDAVVLDNTEANVFFSGPALINNFMYVQLSDEQKKQPVLVQSEWINILYSSTSVNTWSSWSTETWTEVNGVIGGSTSVLGFD